MKTHSLTATFTVTVRLKVRAKSKAAALREAESKCNCVTPMFYPGAHDYEKPRLVQLDGGAWFDHDELDNLLVWQ